MTPLHHNSLVERLWRSGSVYPEEEALELETAADGNEILLEEMANERVAGTPIAWVVGSTVFGDITVKVDAGVYVPRPQSEALVLLAAERLPHTGTAVDLCTGSGAIAALLKRRRPHARILATDVDKRACACARSNGVAVYEGPLDMPLPEGLLGCVDVVISVPPYVPHSEIPYLANDVRTQEPLVALDGGEGGIEVVVQVIAAASRLLKHRGYLYLEIGGDQDTLLSHTFDLHGFWKITHMYDEDRDLRGVVAIKK